MQVIITITLQTIAKLTELLDGDNIDYDVRTFETDDSIAGLGQEPFVITYKENSSL